MCGRFALKTPAMNISNLMHFDNVPTFERRYNIAPSQQILVVRQTAGRRVGVMMHWGLIPSWADDPEIGNRMINARAETLTQRPAFRNLLSKRRCLVPADGFYEWQKRTKSKQPFFIRRMDGQPMAFAGLWDSWGAPDGSTIESCTIITVEAAPPVSDIHNRMPAILSQAQFDAWLSESAPSADLLAILGTPELGALEAYPVDRRVGKPDLDSPDLIEPADNNLASESELF